MSNLGANNKRSGECPSRRRVTGENGAVKQQEMECQKHFRKVPEDVRAIEAIWLDVIVDDMDVRNRSYRRTNCL